MSVKGFTTLLSPKCFLFLSFSGPLRRQIHRDRSWHRERNRLSLAVFNTYWRNSQSHTAKNWNSVAADFLYKSVPGLHSIFMSVWSCYKYLKSDPFFLNQKCIWRYILQKWASGDLVCLPFSPTIWVQIPLKSTAFSLKMLSEKNENNEKEARVGLFS